MIYKVYGSMGLEIFVYIWEKKVREGFRVVYYFVFNFVSFMFLNNFRILCDMGIFLILFKNERYFFKLFERNWFF